MRVELNETGRGTSVGTAVPAEAVAEQISRVDRTSRAIMVGLTELKAGVDSLLEVNRAILAEMRINTEKLGRVADGMDGTVVLLEKLVTASEALRVELGDANSKLQTRIEQAVRGAL